MNAFKIVEGAITLMAFLVFFAFMPFSPARTRPIHGMFDTFTTREKEIMQTRVVSHDRSKAHAKAHINWANFVDAVCDYHLWLHGILNILALAPKGGLQLYGPSIIKSLGFNKTKANLLNSVSSYLVVVLSFLISFASDKTGQRGLFCIVSFVWAIVFGGALLGIGVDSDKWLRYAIFTLLGSGNALAQGLNDAWLNINARSPHKRSIGLAFVVMGSNIGGIVGPELFKSSDAPAYVHGFSAVLSLYAGSILVSMVLIFVYWRDNKKMTKKCEEGNLRPQDVRHFEL